MSVDEISKEIKIEKDKIKKANNRISELQNELRNEKIDKIIENVPLTDPKGNVVAFAIKYESGLLMLYSTINCYKL